jgi:hypothetical protein
MNIKKAQTATEYLIILAVVIVIALVVASLLGGFPGIGASSKQNANTGYWLTTDIVVSGISVNTTNSMTLKVRNNLPDTITITSVRLTSTATGTPLWNTTGSVTLVPGQENTYTLSNTTAVSVAMASGSTAAFNVAVAYTDAIGASRTFTGDRTLTTKVI